MLCIFCSLPVFLTSLVPRNQFGKDRRWNGILRKESQYMKKGTSECSYTLEERVLKWGQKCKYVPPASGLPVTECTSVLIEVGRGSESRVWVEI